MFFLLFIFNESLVKKYTPVDTGVLLALPLKENPSLRTITKYLYALKEEKMSIIATNIFVKR
jgi:hypothetical protein